jgi:NCAIR mutase (PurE)-related protein
VERDETRKLLERVRRGRTSVNEALEALRATTIERLAFATLDLHRAVRRGFPEVVYGPGKTPEQVAEIVRRLRRAGQTVLVTRVGPDVHEVVRRVEPKAVHHPAARAITVPSRRRSRARPGVVVVTAGTADIPVAEEAALVAELMGNSVTRIVDVGVAGLHRLLEHRKTLLAAKVIVVVAGMEGALPSVIAGMTDCPVIGVPTSTGYGVGREGEAALRSMLSSCAGGLTVVNVDNGFGAGFAAGLINRPPRR